MKIGVMLRNLREKGGIVVYATNLLQALLRLDRQNDYIFLYRYDSDRGRFGKQQNLEEVVLPSFSKLWWDQYEVPRFAAKENIDLIYNPKLSIPLLSDSKMVFVMHGGAQVVVPHLFKWYDRIYFTLANKLYCRRADAIITMTHLGAKDLIRYMGADERKIHVIHEAYNPYCKVLSPNEAVRSKYSLPEKFILFVGGITPLKNFGNILRAFQIIPRSLPHKLVVVGFNRWKFKDDLRLVDKLGVGDRIMFPGFVPDEEIPDFYNLAELFVFPTIYEGFGIPILEAMACGCPVITSITGCAPEVAGDAAELVDPYSPEDIALAIERLLTDEALRQSRIKKGLSRATNFSWDKCARETLKVFQSFS